MNHAPPAIHHVTTAHAYCITSWATAGTVVTAINPVLEREWDPTTVCDPNVNFSETVETASIRTILKNGFYTN